MKKPAIPHIPNDPTGVLTAMKENIEIITGVRGRDSYITLSEMEALLANLLTNDQLRAAPLDIALADGAQLSAFGKLNVTTTHTVFDCQNEYGLDTLRIWDAAANGTLATGSTNGSVINGSNAVGPTNTDSRMTPITVSATDTHYSILQSRQYCRYVPGKGNVTFLTGVFAAGSGATASIVWRTKVSGSVVNTEIQQASWNVDKFDGTGVSGITLDFTKIQILVLDAQMLYAGRVRVGFDVDGILYWAHYFKIANNYALPTVQTYNLPLRIDARTGASTTTFDWGRFDASNGIFFRTTRTTKGGTAYFECCSVQNNGDDELRGFPVTSPAGIVTIGVTTRRPILSIRPKATYNSLTNRGHIDDIEVMLRATTNDSFYEIVIGGTLTGASWTSSGTRSISEYDTSSTAISGGDTLVSGFIPSGSGSVSGGVIRSSDSRSPLVLSQIDALTASQTPITIVCTSFGGTSNVTAVMNWHEQTV